MEDLLRRDATDQLAALAQRKVSAVELLKAALARHEQTHRTLNAVVAADLEGALARAAAIDEQRAKGEHPGPLAGLPMTVKDAFDVSGMAASSGLKRLRARMVGDASSVRRAREAGAVVWGKTNTPVMTADWQTYNALYGTTNNPWDPDRTPGGSSGGSAAALAAGVTALELGSDIGGSLRVPASFCGVFSHKPTWGLISQHGHVPPSPGSWSERDLNVVGPLARSARDLRLLLSVVENGSLALRAPPADLAGLRIGLWLDEPSFPLDPQVRSVLETFAGELAAAGAEVVAIGSPVHMPQLMEAYQTLLGGVLGEDLPEGRIRWLTLLRGWARWRVSAGAGSQSAAALALAFTATHREWMAADAVRNRMRRDANRVFATFDAILAPAAPVAAFPHNQRGFAGRRLTASDGGTMPYGAMLNWISLASALHYPAVTVPAGAVPSGLPVGAQLIGPIGADSRLLAIAQAIDENIRGFAAPPAQAGAVS
jgi:amidase